MATHRSTEREGAGLATLPADEPSDSAQSHQPSADASGPTPSQRGTKKVNVVSLGCVENALSSARLLKLFELNAWQMVDSPAEADLVLVNTCGVSQERSQDSVRAIEKLRGSLQPHAKLVATGCLVAIDPSTLESATRDGGVQTVSPRDATPLEKLAGSSQRLRDVRAYSVPDQFMRPRLRALNLFGRLAQAFERLGWPYPQRLHRVLTAFEKEDWYYVQVATGCRNACTYCAIRFAKGAVVSESREQVLEDVRRGIAAGNERIVLVGDDTGSYSLDRGTDLGELLSDLVALPGEFGIHVRNLEPMGLLEVFDRLKAAVATGKIRAITVPLQSGSDRVLEAMARKYRRASAMEALAELRRVNPDLLILTHVMVGFPGETREEFRETLRMIKSFDFDGVAPDCYSPRKGTVAASLEDQLPLVIRKWRYFRAIWFIVWHVYARAGLGLKRRPQLTPQEG